MLLVSCTLMPYNPAIENDTNYKPINLETIYNTPNFPNLDWVYSNGSYYLNIKDIQNISKYHDNMNNYLESLSTQIN